jgi:uncharacterized protein YqjF (DUF2071 family)
MGAESDPTDADGDVRGLPTVRVRFPAMLQTWSTLTFLHWAFPASALARFVPPPLAIDTFEGRGWIGLTPFVVRDLRPPMSPALPWISHGPETNVRTYVRHPDGRRGIMFLSLDIARLPAAFVGRFAYGLPYMWAAASVTDGRTVRYRGGRRWGGAAARWDISVTAGDRIAASEAEELDHFLTARWWMFHHYGERLAATPAEHEPWPLRRGRVERLDETLLAAVGLERPSEPPLVHVSPGVHARIGLPRLAAATREGSRT